MNYIKKVLNVSKDHLGLTVFFTGVIFNIVESLYFGTGTARGFNHKPESIPEYMCDSLSLTTMVVGIYMMSIKIMGLKFFK